MANQLNMELVARILNLVSGIIYVERMELALGELRDRIDYLVDYSMEFALEFDAFHAETKEWIRTIYHDLNVDNAMAFFWDIPDGVMRDVIIFPCLHYIFDYVERRIILDISLDYFGVSGSDDVEQYLQARETRGY